ncbi:hypothetical protein [Candidatus Nitronereus thalassa]|uniref:Uncharacterized protein n=1 Tax=Candidatus Nitronereus thalassa TaxID=3020898 RepID=A0ABU3KD06_9BACT|nr:hypothetical protein [Candidatus Nitronereus thalassa]MDT7044109.1 hypothetical protein [Candidatus Nitronereus thalassa]
MDLGSPSQFDLSNPQWIAVCLALIGIIGTAAYHSIPWIRKRTVYKYCNFNLQILDKFPPNHHELSGLVSFPLNVTDFYVVIKSKDRFSLQRVNLRFLDKNQTFKSHPYGNADLKVIKITSLRYWDDRYVDIESCSDQVGGFGAAFNRTLKKEDGLYFRLGVHIQSPWVGIICFRAIDNDGFESFARNKLVAFGLAYEDAWKVWCGEKNINHCNIAPISITDLETESQPSIELLPKSSQSPDLRLSVHNHGPTAAFSAKCEILSTKNDPNPPRKGLFQLRWILQNDREMMIRQGDKEDLLIARINVDHGSRLGQMIFYELLSNGDAEFTSCRWNLPELELPEYELEIRIYNDGFDKPFLKTFIVRPHLHWGPLEMIEIKVS